MNVELETYALGAFRRIRDAVKDGEYDKAVQICTHGISYIKDLSAKVETNSASDNDVEIF